MSPLVYFSVIALIFIAGVTSIPVETPSSTSPSTANAPNVIESTHELVKVVGSEAVLKCRVVGDPKPVVKWLKNDVELTGRRYNITPQGDLVIRPVTFIDNDIFYCVAENIHGSTLAKETLTVKRRTVITDKPENNEISVGSSAAFRCNANADYTLNLEIVWLKNNEPIDFENQPRFLKLNDNSLLISDSQQFDSGEYTCIARTEIDEARAQATLTVKGDSVNYEVKSTVAPEVVSSVTPEVSPDSVTKFEAYPVGPTAMMLKWEKPETENCSFTGYKIYYQKVVGTETGLLLERKEIDPNLDTVTLSGLEPETKYRITIKVKTRAGEGRGVFVEATTKPK